jgi:hypothetical protein
MKGLPNEKAGDSSGIIQSRPYPARTVKGEESVSARPIQTARDG